MERHKACGCVCDKHSYPLTPEQEGARLFHQGTPFSSMFGDVSERFVHDMEAMELVGKGWQDACRQADGKI